MNHFLAQEGNEKEGFLSESDSHHAIRVLRLQNGGFISVSYGDGKVYRAEISDPNKKTLKFKILELRRTEKKPLLDIAIAPTKSNDRFEWFLEKATELGIATIYPLICDHSERKVYKTERGRRIIEAAFKQSHKGFMPHLEEAQHFNDFISQGLPANTYLASLINQPKKKLQELPFTERCLVLIGPEGDFSQGEQEAAAAKSIQHLDLGPEVLRTETAGVQICSLWNYENQRHGY